jgi:hypothetical protein
VIAAEIGLDHLAAGALVADLFGEGAHCLLGLPRVRQATAAEDARTLTSAVAAAMMVEEEGRRIDLAARRGPRAAR